MSDTDTLANEAQSVVLGVMNAATAGEASDLLDDLLINRDRDEAHLLLVGLVKQLLIAVFHNKQSDVQVDEASNGKNTRSSPYLGHEEYNNSINLSVITTSPNSSPNQSKDVATPTGTNSSIKSSSKLSPSTAAITVPTLTLPVSKLGTIRLPTAAEVGLNDLDYDSGSDIPSQTSESTEVSADSPVDWQQSTSPSIKTHGDLFHAIANSVASLTDINKETLYDDKNDLTLCEQIDVIVRSALDFNDTNGTNNVSSVSNTFTKDVLELISRSIISHLNLADEEAATADDAMMSVFGMFLDEAINREKCTLLAKVVEILFTKLGIGATHDDDSDSDQTDEYPNVSSGNVIPRANSKQQIVIDNFSESVSSNDNYQSFVDDEMDNDSTNPPAWLMPKSPLDEAFKRRIGGLGTYDLNTLVKLTGYDMEDDQQNGYQNFDDEDDDDEDNLNNSSSGRLLAYGLDETAYRSNPVINIPYPTSTTVEEEEDDYIEEPLHITRSQINKGRPPSAIGTRRKYNKNRAIEERNTDDFDTKNNEFDESNDGELVPSAFPAFGIPIKEDGSLFMTNNPSLNKLMWESYRNICRQYGKMDDVENILRQIDGVDYISPSKANRSGTASSASKNQSKYMSNIEEDDLEFTDLQRLIQQEEERDAFGDDDDADSSIQRVNSEFLNKSIKKTSTTSRQRNRPMSGKSGKKKEDTKKARAVTQASTSKTKTKKGKTSTVKAKTSVAGRGGTSLTGAMPMNSFNSLKDLEKFIKSCLT